MAIYVIDLFRENSANPRIAVPDEYGHPALLGGSARERHARDRLLLEPGEYALSGFKFKVAASRSDVRVAEVDSSKLIVDGKAVGGLFTVAAGEAVYIGHFGVDCNGEPTPWRFYIEGKEEFGRYVDGFHKRFPFAKDVTVTYRLFQTERLEQPYALLK